MMMDMFGTEQINDVGELYLTNNKKKDFLV